MFLLPTNYFYRFVKFATLEEAEAAVNMFNGIEIDEVEYVVQSGYKEQSSIDDKVGKKGKMSTSKSKHPGKSVPLFFLKASFFSFCVFFSCFSHSLLFSSTSL